MALSNRAALEGQESDGSARAVIVVPDGHTAAEQSILGVEVGLERVVVDIPLAIDSGLVTSNRGSSHGVRELGLADGWSANIAGLPGLEFNASNWHSSLGTDSEGCHGGDSLCSVNFILVQFKMILVADLGEEHCVKLRE